MQELNHILNSNRNCLFIAPTGWGKTTMLLNLVKESQNKWVYLSPLRALCDEFYSRSKAIRGCFCPRSKKELSALRMKEWNLLVLTPELCTDSLLFEDELIWVLDEFHLFYYWGNSFREVLLNLYNTLNYLNRKLLLLSATIENEVLSFWKKSLMEKVLINLGNQQIKTSPSRRYFFYKDLFDSIALLEGSFTTLIFFKYRFHVHKYEKELEEKGFRVVSCCGGESHLFNEKIKDLNCVDFILGTSALSHGVNLPKISKLVITYEVKNYDMWIQMVGRAGRRGESFELIECDKFRLSWLQKIRILLVSICYKYYLKGRSFYHEC